MNGARHLIAISMLSSYPNVYNTCLIILQRRGFKLRCELPAENWIAEKSGFTFLADNPIELLGLVGIHDELRPESDTDDWWKIEKPDIHQELLSDAQA